MNESIVMTATARLLRSNCRLEASATAPTRTLAVALEEGIWNLHILALPKSAQMARVGRSIRCKKSRVCRCSRHKFHPKAYNRAEISGFLSDNVTDSYLFSYTFRLRSYNN